MSCDVVYNPQPPTACTSTSSFPTYLPIVPVTSKEESCPPQTSTISQFPVELTTKSHSAHQQHTSATGKSSHVYDLPNKSVSIQTGRCAKEGHHQKVQYLTERCILLTYFQGDVEQEIEDHFNKALANKGPPPMASRRFPASFWRKPSRARPATSQTSRTSSSPCDSSVSLSPHSQHTSNNESNLEVRQSGYQFPNWNLHSPKSTNTESTVTFHSDDCLRLRGEEADNRSQQHDPRLRSPEPQPIHHQHIEAASSYVSPTYSYNSQFWSPIPAHTQPPQSSQFPPDQFPPSRPTPTYNYHSFFQTHQPSAYSSNTAGFEGSHYMIPPPEVSPLTRDIYWL